MREPEPVPGAVVEPRLRALELPLDATLHSFLDPFRLRLDALGLGLDAILELLYRGVDVGVAVVIDVDIVIVVVVGIDIDVDIVVGVGVVVVGR